MSNNRRVTILEGSRSSTKARFKEFVERKDLLYFFVVKEVKILYSQTFFGIGWVILNPLLNTLILTIVFNKLAQVSSDGIPYPVFCLSGLLPWIYFSSTVTKAASSLALNMKVMTKVYFPKVFIPFTPLLAKLIDLSIGMLCLAVLMPFYDLHFSSQLALVFIPLLILLLATAGFSLWISGLSILFRDIRHSIPLVIHLLLFASPVIFPASLVKNQFGYEAYVIYGFYPLVGAIEGFRATLFGSSIPWDLLGASLVGALICFITGLKYFQDNEKTFADL